MGCRGREYVEKHHAIRESAGSDLESCIIERHGAHRETGENGCRAVLEKYNTCPNPQAFAIIM
jgi:hypothetical protein